MRFQFWVLSGLMGCLALLMWLVPGHTQNPSAPQAEREQGTQNPSAPPVESKRGARTQLPTNPTAGPVSTNWADVRFRQLDRNGDGHLSFDEMTANLKIEKDKWDVNGDGLIDLEEWRAYVAAFMARGRLPATDPGNRVRDPNRPPSTQVPGQEPQVQGAKRPPFDEARLSRPMNQRNKDGTSRAAKLPRNIPAWFKEYDADGDGQVALYEWKDMEDNVREFKKYDLNGDGFITVEELIRSGQFWTGPNKMPPALNGVPATVGDFFYFEVTGVSQGPVWGTDLYTTDSFIPTVAVHAGVLRAGQTGLVKVTFLPGEQSYVGSVRNGVMTQAYGPFPNSFSIELAPQSPR